MLRRYQGLYAIARKNFFFADTAAGAGACGRIFSLIETARANGHNPQRDLTILLNALPNIATVDEIGALLPWNLTLAQVNDLYAAYPKPQAIPQSGDRLCAI